MRGSILVMTLSISDLSVGDRFRVVDPPLKALGAVYTVQAKDMQGVARCFDGVKTTFFLSPCVMVEREP